MPVEKLFDMPAGGKVIGPGQDFVSIYGSAETFVVVLTGYFTAALDQLVKRSQFGAALNRELAGGQADRWVRVHVQHEALLVKVDSRPIICPKKSLLRRGHQTRLERQNKNCCFFTPHRCCAAGTSVSWKAMCLAIPGRISSISGDDPLMRTGKVDFGGILKEVSLAYVPEATVGDYVIVHVGFALSRVDEAEAQQVFEYLREMRELSELEESGAGVSPAAAGPPAR
jgi:hydrogenase expression/formation protein HypC